jgi:hypothetical protein
MTTTAKNHKEDEAIFDCIIQEAERQRVKHPEHVDAIDAVEKRTRSLVKGGKLEESLMLVEFTRALERLWAPKISPKTLHNAIQYASE